MDSDIHHLRHYQQQPQHNMINSGLYGDDIFSRFMSSSACADNSISQIRVNESQLMNIRKQELQHMMYQNLAQSQEIGHNNSLIVSGSSDRVDGLMVMAPATNLLRLSSSPAGFFEHIYIDNGSHSSSRLPSHIVETKGKTMANYNGRFGETHMKAAGYVASFPIGSWNESSMLTYQMSSFETQNEGEIHTRTGLTHKLSLPTSSTELSVMKNQLQFQDNVPLRSRAKRGFATHPRSIAERVRRTRISERIRKLEDLVPNMDKQTSISDMLDLAVDYIKDLRTKVETLAGHHAKCTCANKKNS